MTSFLIDGTRRQGSGSPAGTGVSATEAADPLPMRETQLTFDNTLISLTDEAGVVAYGGLKVFDFPEGLIVIFGASSDLAITKTSAGVDDDWDGDFGVGTVTASNNASLATTEQNIIPTTATPQASSGATTADGQSTAVLHLDGTATAPDMYLNFLVDDADQDVTTTACDLIINGTLTFLWAKIGDN